MDIFFTLTCAIIFFLLTYVIMFILPYEKRIKRNKKDKEILNYVKKDESIRLEIPERYFEENQMLVLLSTKKDNTGFELPRYKRF